MRFYQSSVKQNRDYQVPSCFNEHVYELMTRFDQTAEVHGLKLVKDIIILQLSLSYRFICSFSTVN